MGAASEMVSNIEVSTDGGHGEEGERAKIHEFQNKTIERKNSLPW